MIRGYSAIWQEYIYDWLAHSEDIGVFNIDLVFLHKSTKSWISQSQSIHHRNLEREKKRREDIGYSQL